MKLKNKIAIVTGGASGIGEASAKLFAKEGAYVFILDINKEKGSALAKEINGKFFEFDMFLTLILLLQENDTSIEVEMLRRKEI